MLILQLAILVYSIILHEISHGWVADKLGDPTARLSGRLTLNPIPHIDPIMTILLPFFLTLTGSPVIFGSAKPVPIDSFNFREPKKDTALTAAAGPITNLLIALFFALIFKIYPMDLFYYAVQINVFLAIFNLLPVPPLDGSKVLAGVLPNEFAGLFLSLERYGFIIIFAILFFFPGIINNTVVPISQTIIHLLLSV